MSAGTERDRGVIPVRAVQGASARARPARFMDAGIPRWSCPPGGTLPGAAAPLRRACCCYR